MKRVQSIIDNPLYIRETSACEEAEKERIFCRHDRAHAVNVARIGYILLLENNIDCKKDVFYAAALLHDIGRNEEYKTGRSHREAGIIISEKILETCEFSDQETRQILEIIQNHSGHKNALHMDGFPKTVQEAFDLADYWSRDCASCKAREDCKWEIKHIQMDL